MGPFSNSLQDVILFHDGRHHTTAAMLLTRPPAAKSALLCTHAHVFARGCCSALCTFRVSLWPVAASVWKRLTHMNSSLQGGACVSLSFQSERAPGLVGLVCVCLCVLSLVLLCFSCVCTLWLPSDENKAKRSSSTHSAGMSSDCQCCGTDWLYKVYSEGVLLYKFVYLILIWDYLPTAVVQNIITARSSLFKLTWNMQLGHHRNTNTSSTTLAPCMSGLVGRFWHYNTVYSLLNVLHL